ncbi:MAG: hypothetical protein R2873_35930 [Caldilineaceae bacterium]
MIYWQHHSLVYPKAAAAFDFNVEIQRLQRIEPSFGQREGEGDLGPAVGGPRRDRPRPALTGPRRWDGDAASPATSLAERPRPDVAFVAALSLVRRKDALAQPHWSAAQVGAHGMAGGRAGCRSPRRGVWPSTARGRRAQYRRRGRASRSR